MQLLRNKFLKFIFFSLIYPIFVFLGCIYLEMIHWKTSFIFNYILIIPIFFSLFISYFEFKSLIKAILPTIFGIAFTFFCLVILLPDL